MEYIQEVMEGKNLKKHLDLLNQEYVNAQLLIEKHKRFIKELKDQLKDLIKQIEGVKEVDAHE